MQIVIDCSRISKYPRGGLFKKLKHEKAIEGDKGGDKLIPDKRSSSRQTEGVSQTSVICGHQDFLSWIILTQLGDAVNS